MAKGKTGHGVSKLKLSASNLGGKVHRMEKDGDAEASSRQEKNRVRNALVGAAQKAGNVSRVAVEKVKQVSHHSFEATEHDDPPTTEQEHESSTEGERAQSDGESKNVSSEPSTVSKITAATKKTLAKPMNATKKVITSTGSAVNLKKKKKPESQKRGSAAVSDVSGDESDANDDNTVEVRDTDPADEESEKAPDVKEERETIMIYMGPVLSFLLHDATIAIGSSLIIAAYPTFCSWDLIRESQIPLSVAITWILVAFAVGYEAAMFRAMPVTGVYNDIANEDLTIPSVIDVPIQTPKRGYSILHRMSVKFPKGLKIHLPRQSQQDRAQSTLTTKRGEQPRWQRRARAPVSNPLMQRLLRNPSYQRSSVQVEGQVETEETDTDTHMGAYVLTEAESLRDDVVEPIFHLRGMDIFMTENLPDGAEDNISEHPFLLENGLRDTPSFVINAMTQWANLLIYFEMPFWVKDWNDIVEKEDDPDDVKALKRFLNGDDKYKDLRLKMLPYVVDGPLPIRVLAPAKREITVHCELLPTKWRKRGGTTRPDGRYLHPCLELEMDLMANKMMRGFSSLVNRHIQKMSVDVALVIDTPDLQKEVEPSACLGMWRFDRVDISDCPDLPERLGRSVRADTVRATMLAQQTEMNIESLQRELDCVVEEE